MKVSIDLAHVSPAKRARMSRIRMVLTERLNSIIMS